MRKTDELDKFYAEIIASIKDQESNAQFPEFFYNILLAGDNKIYQKVITETKRFDGEWIQTLESYFPSLDRIIKNPKSALKYEEEITVLIGRVRRRRMPLPVAGGIHDGGRPGPRYRPVGGGGRKRRCRDRVHVLRGPHRIRDRAL